MRPLVAIIVVGLTPRLLAHAPRIRRLADEGFMARLTPPLPAVTCTSQATMVTGLAPRDHGVVANGWYFRDLAEVMFWRQSSALVSGERLWEAARARAPGLRTAQLFWWFNMYASVELSATPRPHYPADGRKIPGIYTEPPALEGDLEGALGPFPLFSFWGPGANIDSSRWIARAARRVLEREKPGLTLVYLPHLDYDLQRLGPGDERIPAAVEAVDALVEDLAERAREQGAGVVVLSEYGIEAATTPVHVNRALREAGLLRVRESRFTGELLDAGASRAFAVADHQLAHVYVRDPADRARVKALVEKLPGVDRVLDEDGKRAAGLDHPRSGELVAVAGKGAWFTYYHWLDDARAPDFARTVDIHRKPGYDPCELLLDPAIALPPVKIGWTLLKKALGFRYLLNVIPLDATLVKGTHGRLPDDPDEAPLLISTSKTGAADRLDMTAVKGVLLNTLLS
ncbi:MAG TPA: alkaline phosphatase family protein [Planctomycetota bacterium]|nr:alkaline phosphatase family protein [Planctomycetota bacterium]